MMVRNVVICLALFLLTVVHVAAGEKESEPKELSGMSIIGNDEAPKSLYIVPWKSSDLGVEATLERMLTEDDVPVDREVFMRQLDFYDVRTAKNDEFGRKN